MTDTINAPKTEARRVELLMMGYDEFKASAAGAPLPFAENGGPRCVREHGGDPRPIMRPEPAPVGEVELDSASAEVAR